MEKIKTIWIIWKLWSWKDIVWSYLENEINWVKYELSQVLKDEAVRKWISPVRDNLIPLLQEKHTEFWKRYLMREVLKPLSLPWIITWIRLVEQIKELKESTDCFLIYVDAERELRFKRQLDRKREWDPICIADMKRIEENEESDLQSTILQEEIINMADIILDNNGSLEALYEKLNKMVKNFKMRF